MKQKGLKERAPGEVEQVSHLDEKLTEITTHTADALRRWRRVLLAVVIVGIAGYGIYFIASASRESRREYFNQEIYELFHSPAARKQGYKPDMSRLDKLLEDVKGDPAEKMALQEAVGWYLEYADRERKTQAIPGFQEAEGPISEAEAKEARAQAVRLASEAAGRNSDDTELQLWAAAVKRKVDAEAARPWQKDKRRYVPPVPDAVPSGSPPGAETSGSTPSTAAAPGASSAAEVPPSNPSKGTDGAPSPATAPPSPTPEPQPPVGAQSAAGEKSEKASP